MASHPSLIGVTTGKRRAADSPLPFHGAAITYSDAVATGGGAPVLIPFALPQPSLRALYERMDGIILSGGGDVDPVAYGAEPHSTIQGIDAERDHIEIQLVQWAVNESKPLLAICRGIQVLNVALGGTLIRDIPSEVPNALTHKQEPLSFETLSHSVSLVPGSMLHRALNIEDEELSVNSLHHQAIDQVAPTLHVTARAPDGIIEGVELPEHRFLIGIQWHPEALIHTHAPMLHLFQALIRVASAC